MRELFFKIHPSLRDFLAFAATNKKIYELSPKDVWSYRDKTYHLTAIRCMVFPRKVVAKMVEQKSREKNIKSREKIVALLSENGKLSAVALAEKIGISAKTIEKHLANLKADGIIEHIGPAKGGRWKVINHQK